MCGSFLTSPFFIGAIGFISSNGFGFTVSFPLASAPSQMPVVFVDWMYESRLPTNRAFGFLGASHVMGCRDDGSFSPPGW
jgi:hypothetical protein